MKSHAWSSADPGSDQSRIIALLRATRAVSGYVYLVRLVVSPVSLRSIRSTLDSSAIIVLGAMLMDREHSSERAYRSSRRAKGFWAQISTRYQGQGPAARQSLGIAVLTSTGARRIRENARTRGRMGGKVGKQQCQDLGVPHDSSDFPIPRLRE